MLKAIFEFIIDLFKEGQRAAAVVLVVVMLLVLAELGQSHLLGSKAFQVASKVVPWNPIFTSRAALHASFQITLPDRSKRLMQDDAEPCPVGSQIALEFERSRTGYIAAFAITEPFKNSGSAGVSALTSSGLTALLYDGQAMQRNNLSITSADGLEVFVIVSADKPFNPVEDIVPTIRNLESVLGKGAEAQLAGFDIDWTDTPVIVTCNSA